jgi:hypothetical protein
VFFGPQHTLIAATPVVLETLPANRDAEDFNTWVQNFYTWDVYKLLIEQKENTDSAYAFEGMDREPLTVQAESLTPAQQDLRRELERRLHERLRN